MSFFPFNLTHTLQGSTC